MRAFLIVLLLLAMVTASHAQIPNGAKLYVMRGSDGFDKVLAASIIKKKVPVVLVDSAADADYWIDYAVDWPNNEAWIKLTERITHRIVWAYTCHSASFWRHQDMRYAADCLAKHLKEVVGKLGFQRITVRVKRKSKETPAIS